MLADASDHEEGSSSKISHKRMINPQKPTLATLRCLEKDEFFTELPSLNNNPSPNTSQKQDHLPDAEHVESPNCAPRYTFMQHYESAETFLDNKGCHIVEATAPQSKKEIHNKDCMQQPDNQQQNTNKFNNLSTPIDSSLMRRRKLGVAPANSIIIRNLMPVQQTEEDPDTHHPIKTNGGRCEEDFNVKCHPVNIDKN